MICSLSFHTWHQCQIHEINPFLENWNSNRQTLLKLLPSMWVLMLSVGLLVIQKALSVPPRELYVLIVKYYLITSVSKKNKCCSDCSAWLTAVLHLRKQWVSEWSKTKSTLFAVSMVHSVHYSLMWVTVSRKFIFSKLKNWGLAHKLVDNKKYPLLMVLNAALVLFW